MEKDGPVQARLRCPYRPRGDSWGRLLMDIDDGMAPKRRCVKTGSSTSWTYTRFSKKMVRKPLVMMRVVVAALFFLVCCSSVEGTYNQTDLRQWLRRAESLLARTDSYTAIFHKQERIQEKLTDEETIFIKFKKPFKVYMKWIKAPYNGRESLYVEGQNGNLIKIRECGLAGLITVDLAAKSPLIMKGSRHPVTDSGLENLVKLIGENVEKGIRAGEVDFREHGEEKVYGTITQQIEIIFPRNKARGYYCYRAVVNLDAEKKLPVMVQIYDWNDILLEKYGYEAVRLDAGLTEADFDPVNAEYRF